MGLTIPSKPSIPAVGDLYNDTMGTALTSLSELLFWFFIMSAATGTTESIQSADLRRHENYRNLKKESGIWSV